MKKEDVILNLTDGKDGIRLAIDKLTKTLCDLAQKDNESEDDRRNLSNIAYGIEKLEDISWNIAQLSKILGFK